MTGYFPEDEQAEAQDGALAALTLSMLEHQAADLATVLANPLPEWDAEQHMDAIAGIQAVRAELAVAEQGLLRALGRLTRVER